MPSHELLTCSSLRRFYPRLVSGPAASSCSQRCSGTTRPRSRSYIFIGGAPGHGTTALYAFMSTSSNASNLCGIAGPLCEGSYFVSKPCMPTSDIDGSLLARIRAARGCTKCETCIDARATGAMWTHEWAARQNWTTRVLRSFRQIWHRRKCVHMEKSPNNLVWAPYYVDALTRGEDSVPLGAITIVLLTRSPCFPPASVLHDTAGWRTKHNHDLRAAFPSLGERAGVQAHEEAWLNLTTDAVDRLSSMGARVVLVDYQTLVHDPRGSAMALSKLMPCLGQLNASAPPDFRLAGPHPRHNRSAPAGRGDSLQSFADSKPRAATADTLKVVDASPVMMRALRRLGYFWEDEDPVIKPL